ncbi:GTP cyclohydrolase II [Winogradskyella litoriviva]|uniref:GTP cyclohydrolase-2 n=1 Tax=Winogradskyella litoriviva TaxID=1220182 RepID=A0ABX2E322_9FLAO|nr:GTP cyclohydrolase II [Winogradskyella litoriviva]NRD22878.1 GTP cyclohydrolase II [Winogradskyella litoriviva]
MTKTYTNILQGERVQLPTKYGHFEIVPFQEKATGIEHMALIKGNFTAKDTVLTRIHSSCATGDLFGSLKCDCGEQLNEAMKIIENNGSGVIVYLQQEGRGIGLMNKMKAYKLQELGMDTIEANIELGFAEDERDYKIGAEILSALGVSKLNLLTNNPDKIIGLEQHGIEIIKRIPLIIKSNPFNKFYLDTKENHMGHQLKEEKGETQHYDN